MYFFLSLEDKLNEFANLALMLPSSLSTRIRSSSLLFAALMSETKLLSVRY